MANIHEGKEVLLCKKTIIITKNKTEESLKINRAGAVSGYFKGIEKYSRS